MMKRILSGLLGSILLLHAGPVLALSLSFAPSFQQVLVGRTFHVDLRIAGLGQCLPPTCTAPSVGAFDLLMSWDPKILRLAFPFVEYGDPLLGDLLALTGPSIQLTTGPAVVGGKEFIELVELSLDPPNELDANQPDSFTLARLTFEAELNGESHFRIEGPLGISGVRELADAVGNPLVVNELHLGVVEVVPEPATWLLISTGVIGLLGYGWRRGRRTVGEARMPQRDTRRRTTQ